MAKEQPKHVGAINKYILRKSYTIPVRLLVIFTLITGNLYVLMFQQ
jgi:hypothetical protein